MLFPFLRRALVPLFLLFTLPIGAQRATIDRADSLMRAGQADLARPLFAGVADDEDVGDSLRAVAYLRLAKLYHQRPDAASKDTAITYAHRSIDLLEDMSPRSPLALARAYAALGQGFQRIQPDSGEVYHRKAIALFETLPNPPPADYIGSYSGLSRIGQLLGNDALALNAAKKGIELLMVLDGVTPTLRYETYMFAALRQRAFEVDDSGLGFGQLSVEYAKRTGDPVKTARALVNMGAIHFTRREIDLEKACYLSAIDVLDGHPGGGVNLGSIYFNLSYLNTREEDYSSALQHNAAALALYREHQPGKVWRTYFTRGLIYAGAGQYDLQLAALDSAMRIQTDGQFEERHGLAYPLLDSVANKPESVELLRSRLEPMIDAGLAPDDILREALAFLDARDYLYAKSTSGADEATWGNFGQAELEAVIAHLIPEANEDVRWGVLSLIDRSRGAGLLTALRVRAERDDARQKELTAEIARLERLPNPDADQSSRLTAIRLELDKYRSEIRANLPAPRATTPEELREYLSGVRGDVFSYYASGYAAFLAHRAADGQLRIHQLDSPDALANNVRLFRQTVTAGPEKIATRAGEDRQERNLRSQAIASRLREQLFPDVDLSELSDRLLFVVDGHLAFLPFSALRVAAESPFLGEGRYVRYAYTLDHLRAVEAAEPLAYDTPVMGFAPTFEGSASVLAVSEARGRVAVGLDTNTLQLGPLRYNQREIADIEAMIPGGIYHLGENATKSSFLSHDRRARVLHLSTHGIVDADDPNLSFVAFSGNEFLYFNDLKGQPFAADLVVLSACETSLGLPKEGETTQSMAAAFAAAGAASTLTSLWQVDDKATQLLMKRFYESLLAGKDRVEALSDAQSYLRTQTPYADPYYWAAFTLQGIDGPIMLSAGSASPYLLWLLVGCVLAAIIGVWARKFF